jgi:AcrR family transcriptional regulator
MATTHNETTLDTADTAGASADAEGDSDTGSRSVTRVDGRVLRGLRNRQSLIDACYALTAETLEAPRAIDIAERAGVSVRSLFQHFSDLDELRAAVVEEMCHRALEHLLLENDLTSPSLRLHARLEHTLRVRTTLWEMLGPLRQLDMLRDGGDRHRRIVGPITQLRAVLRDHLRIAFAAEISAMPLEDELALTALQATLSEANWDHLRLVHGYSIDTTLDVMRHMALAVLGHGRND